MKKIVFSLALIMCAVMLLSGCSVLTNILNPIPEEYVDGLKVPRDFPDDELEIYDDAIVFEVEEEDDEEIALSFGTEDDIDDVADFYEDLFDDNDLYVEEMETDDDEFYAKGSGDGFEFEIEAAPAKGDIEERVFVTVVEITVEFVEVVVNPEPQPEETDRPAGANTLLMDIQGFWHACGSDGVIDVTVSEGGLGYEFFDETLTVYLGFDLLVSGIEITIVDEDTFSYVEDGITETIDVYFEVIEGVAVMSLHSQSDDMTVHFIETTYNDFLIYADSLGEEGGDIILLSEDLSDEDLEWYISDLNWYYIIYLYPDGTYEEGTNPNRMYLSYDYTGEDEVDGVIDNITWYVWDGHLYITYPDGSEYYWPVDYEYDGEGAYLYLYDLEEGYEGCSWVYTLNP